MRFADLHKKYNGFQVPKAALYAGGKDILSDCEVAVIELTVELSTGLDAQSAAFEIAIPIGSNMYNSLIPNTLKLGALIKIKLGYPGKLSDVFYGYIHMLEYYTHYDKGDIIIKALCLDCKGLMMTANSFVTDINKTLSKVISAIAAKSTYNKLLKSKEITSIPAELDKVWSIRCQSDYEVMCEAAKYLDYEFYFLVDKLKFVSPKKGAELAAELSKNSGISFINLMTKITGQYKQITAVGADKKGDKITYCTKRSSSSRPGEKELNTILDSEGMTIVVPGSSTKGELKLVTETNMRKSESMYAEAEIKTIGIPELMPGSYIQVSDDVSIIAGKYYIIEAVHKFDENGYFCELKTQRE